MTDRVSHLIVTLKEDTRVDDLQWIIELIGQIGSVASVTPGPAVKAADAVVVRHRARHELRDKMLVAIDGVLFPAED